MRRGTRSAALVFVLALSVAATSARAALTAYAVPDPATLVPEPALTAFFPVIIGGILIRKRR